MSTQSNRKSDKSVSSTTTEQARKLAHGAVDSAADRAEGVEKKVRDEAARFAERAQEGKEEAKQQFDDTVARLDTFVKERPAAALGIAFAGGALAALILKRS
jgi:ElaB/YqjD/DUF883 family membrane-anchored ribosome-binding protein